VLFSNGYNTETSKIIETTFLTLHFLPYAIFFAGQGGGAWPKWPNNKYASGRGQLMLRSHSQLVTGTVQPSFSSV